ncbi:MAG: hypothetical protein AB4040_02275 [Synechococcus sp.]
MSIQLDEKILAQLSEHGVTVPPTQDDLTTTMGSRWIRPAMLLKCVSLFPLRLWWKDRDEGFVGGNTFVHYSLKQVRDRDFKGPFFLRCWGCRSGNARVG